jgi:hypothetical protein
MGTMYRHAAQRLNGFRMVFRIAGFKPAYGSADQRSSKFTVCHESESPVTVHCGHCMRPVIMLIAACLFRSGSEMQQGVY